MPHERYCLKTVSYEILIVQLINYFQFTGDLYRSEDTVSYSLYYVE